MDLRRCILAERRRPVPLSFAKGLHREHATEVYAETAQRLINWEPRPDGGLVVRRGWGISSVLGDLPAVGQRKVRSIAALPVASGRETPIRRQRIRRAKYGAASGANGTVMGIDCPWKDETLEDSLLLAFLSYSTWKDDGTHTATSTVTVTPPAGWTSVGVVHSNDAPSSVSLRIYKIEGAAEREGFEEFTFNTGVRRVQLDLQEWRGVATAGAEDVFKSDSGFDARPDTDFSVATDAADPKQLVIGAIAARTSDKSIKPSDFPEGWFPMRDAYDPPYRSTGREDYFLNQVVARRIVLTDGTQRLYASLDATEQEDDAKSRWVAALVSFKARERSAAGDKDYYILDVEEDTDEHGLYAIDMDNLTGAAWDNFGDLVAGDGSVTNRPLAMADGLGGMLITSKDVLKDAAAKAKGLFQWDGTSLIRINRSPRANSVAFHRGRFFALGTKERPADLFWSAVGDQTTWDMDRWFITVGGDGEQGLDVASVGDQLLVAKRDSLHLVSGPASGISTQELPGGGGMAGRCICPVPGGAVIAGRDHIWMWQGGAPHLISRALDDWWVNPGRQFVYTAFVNGRVYILGADEDTCVVYDTATQVWWVDKPPVKLRAIFSRNHRELVGGIDNSTSAVMALLQDHPIGTRRKDDGFAEDFEVWTQEMMLGTPSRPATPKNLYVRFTKRNYQAGHPVLEVTPVYDGVAQTPRNITEAHPVSGDVQGNGTFMQRLDVGVKDASAAHKVQYKFSYEAAAGNTTVFDIDAIELVFDVEEQR